MKGGLLCLTQYRSSGFQPSPKLLLRKTFFMLKPLDVNGKNSSVCHIFSVHH